MIKRKGNRKKRVFTLLLLLISIPVQMVTAAIISCILIFYSPFFPTVRRYIVETTMSTYTQQYISHIFLSDTEIQKILAETTSAATVAQRVGDVKIAGLNSRSIDRYEISGKNYHGWLLVVSDPTRVKVGYTRFLLKVGETTSDIAKDHDAVAAVNGGGFSGGSSWTGTGAVPTNFVFSNGSLVWKQSGLSDGELCNVIALDKQGKLIVGSHSIDGLKQLGVTNAVTMPGYKPLIVNGEGAFRGSSGLDMNPRTAIAQTRDGSILLLVLDGRRINMLGATLLDVQNILLSKEAYNAAVLDGGSSTTMYSNGNIINQPCDAFGERTVATAFYVER